MGRYEDQLAAADARRRAEAARREQREVDYLRNRVFTPEELAKWQRLEGEATVFPRDLRRRASVRGWVLLTVWVVAVVALAVVLFAPGKPVHASWLFWVMLVALVFGSIPALWAFSRGFRDGFKAHQAECAERATRYLASIDFDERLRVEKIKVADERDADRRFRDAMERMNSKGRRWH